MKRKELEEFKKRWEENLGGLGDMIVRKNPVSAFQGIKLRP